MMWGHGQSIIMGDARQRERRWDDGLEPCKAQTNVKLKSESDGEECEIGKANLMVKNVKLKGEIDGEEDDAVEK
jgi:hypothetical protein